VGIRPTHLDSHMGTCFQPQFIQRYVELGLAKGIPVLMFGGHMQHISAEAGQFKPLLRSLAEELWRAGLPVIDDLERALAQFDNSKDLEGLSKGVEMITRSLQEIIKNEGVEPIEALGQAFDPQYHQPLIVEESDEHSENTVIEEFQAGYILHGRVIRPSLVKVSK